MERSPTQEQKKRHTLLLIFKTVFLAMVLCVIGAQTYAKPFEYQKEIDALYMTRDGAPLWMEGNKINENGKVLNEYLQKSWHHGLNPKKYSVNFDDLEPVQKEILLTQAYVKYARDLSGMRIEPEDINLDPNHWKRSMSAKTAIKKLNQNQTSITQFLENLSPQTQTYKALKAEMSIKPSRELALNMERLRWLPSKNPRRFIIVNIPSARLWAIEKNKTMFEMPVIIGRKDRPTPSFITNITGVRFNPTWTIPSTIKEKDIWPELKQNPAYLRDKEVEVFKEEKTIDPTIIEWGAMSRKQLHALRMVQLPGPENPLGKIRILMPNNYSIFLHDSSELGFSDLERSYSSGCVRLQNPEKVAHFILQRDVKAYLKNQQTKDIFAKEKIPVRLLYQTVWLGAGQKIIYGQDIYGYNKKLAIALDKINGLPDLEQD